MGLPIYLAMTSWEYDFCPTLPAHIAWMACHFSPYTRGLSNLPDQLPEHSLLMLNDRIPPDFHDPNCIAEQLQQTAERIKISGLVLDFQRPFGDETARIAEKLIAALSCPVAVTPAYAAQNNSIVFVPPVPPDQNISDYLQPWNGREVWLETEKTGTCLTVTQTGCDIQRLSDPVTEPFFVDEALCCHYTIRMPENKAVFSLFRTEEDQTALLTKAEQLGVTLAVGLYQEA